MAKNLIYIILTGTLLSLLTSCNVNKYLEGDQTFLKKQDIVMDGKLAKVNRSSVTSGLGNLLLQQPNEGFVWVPRHWFYYRNQKLQKDNWYWNFINSNISRPPSLIDTALMERTCKNMSDYLITKGYLHPKVTYEVQPIKGFRFWRSKSTNSELTYHILPGELATIDKFSIISKDSSLLEVIQKNRDVKYLTKESPIDKDLYTEEVNNIVRIAHNNGYPQFYSNYVDLLSIDTTEGFNDVRLSIFRPSGKSQHKQYTLGDIRLKSDGYTGIQQDTLVNGIICDAPLSNYLVQYKYLLRKIKIQKGDIYSKQELDRSLRNLSSFDIYQFPISQVDIDTASNTVDIGIQMNRRARRAYSANLELFYSNISQFNNQLIGISNSHQLVDRNLFGGGEVWITDLEGSFELGLNNAPNASANSYNFNFGTELRLPRYIKYPIVSSLTDWIFGQSASYAKFKDEANTSISLLYQYTQRQSFFTYNSIEANYGYQYRPSDFLDIRINHFAVNYWVPAIEPQFDQIIGDNEFFRRRFTKRFITGFLFNDLIVEARKPENKFGESYFFLGEFETSGLEILGAEAIARSMGAQTPFEIPLEVDTIAFSKFIRVLIDGRYYRKLKSNQSIGVRVSAGLGLGLDNEGVPYIRQFFVGGPYSIRAFPVRSLGPGSFRADSAFVAQRLPFFQTGDFKFEASFEYKFKIAWIMEGALFYDIGNVWNLNDENEEYNLSWDSYTQLAMGTGFGLRFLLPYNIILRFDLGYPIRYPYKIRGSKWIFNQDFSSPEISYFQPIQLNFAINYPF